ncbi:tetratricopeptide repeat protein [Actinophytocola xanthii]|uniref:hypothetical protein n=1 Tax=Actinophytocola xanthii TaxID=1912961 RepID=UPI001178AC3B|nr:hypothetical protein [Actinophytocola xanthii]
MAGEGLGDTGADQEAGQLLRFHAERRDDGAPGDPSAMWGLADWLVRYNRIAGAVHWYVLSAEHGAQGMGQLVDTLGELGCLDAAEPTLRARAAKGSGLARSKLVELLELLGHHDEAAAVLRQSLRDDDSYPLPGRTSAPPTMSRLVDALRQAGETQEATQIAKYGIEPGGATVQPWELPTPR